SSLRQPPTSSLFPYTTLFRSEAILRLCDSETLEGTEPPRGYLRFWESPTHFVVLGVSGRLDEELDLETCRRDGLPILRRGSGGRSEEHTSELQSRENLVCRLL